MIQISTKLNKIVGLAILTLSMLFVSFAILPIYKAEASHNDDCSAGRVCGYNREITRSQPYPTYNAPSPNTSGVCQGGYICGANIDHTVKPQIYPENTISYQNQTVQNPKPVINSVSPNSVESGTGEVIVTVYGLNFVPSSVVKFNSSDRATTYEDGEKLKVKLTEADINGSGEYLITVFNPAPGGGFSNAEFFTILGGPTEPKAPEESNLSAGAIMADSGFFPNNFFGWVLLGLVILLAVILWRKLYISAKEKNAPLKHA